MKKIFLYLFFAVALGEVISVVYELEWLEYVCKPMIMISLGLYYYAALERPDRSTMVFGAIMFSLAGDVFLMLADYFIPGLISFLLSHLLYIVVYRQHREERHESSLKGVQMIRLAFPVILAGTGLVIILYPVLGSLKIPVIVYAIVLALMVLNALFRFNRTNSASFWMVFIGAVLFMISDSVLAINKFLSSFAEAGFVIMVTYMAAQFLIIRGLVKHADETA